MYKLRAVAIGMAVIGLVSWACAARGDGPVTAQDYVNRGWDRYLKNDAAGAEQDFTKAIELDPNNLNAYNDRGLAREVLGNKKGAEDDYTKALDISPYNAVIYFNRGELRNGLGFTAGAMADFNKAIEYNPNYAAAYHERGLCWSNQGNPKSAIIDYTKSIELDPKNGLTFLDRAWEYRISTKDYQKALADYNTGLEIVPNNLVGVVGRGETKRLLGDFTGAIADFNKAIAIKPANSTWSDETFCYTARDGGNGRRRFQGGDKGFRPRLVDGSTLRQRPVRRGVLELKQGNKDAAQKDFDAAVAVQPNLKDQVAEELKKVAGGTTTAGRPTTTK